MMEWKLSFNKQAKQAAVIGSICSVSYLATYVARNALGSCTPQMLEMGNYTTEMIGAMSSVYFIVYALGQLANGMLGDYLSPKYMMTIGLLGAGFCIDILLATSSISVLLLVYGTMGYFLSMTYAPMTRVIAENTKPIYATRCTLGTGLASLLGSPIAGMLAAFFIWQIVFQVSSIFLFFMAAVVFVTFGILEKKTILQYHHKRRQKENKGSIKVLIRHRILRMTLFSAITGIVRTSVVFWLPTYLKQYLGYPVEIAVSIYAGITLCLSVAPFFAVYLLERLHKKTGLTMFLLFLSSAICFLLCFFIHQAVLNITLLTAALFASAGVTALIGSVYCPSLYETGMVSTAAGYLNFISYMAAALANHLFANAVGDIGWGYLLLVWCGIVSLGCIGYYKEK